VETSGAQVHAVSDEDIVVAWLELAREEGLFCEPSSAAGIAFLRASGELRGARVVVTITGHGLKDPGAADFHAPPPVTVDPDPDAIARAAELARSRFASGRRRRPRTSAPPSTAPVSRSTSGTSSRSGRLEGCRTRPRTTCA